MTRHLACYWLLTFLLLLRQLAPLAAHATPSGNPAPAMPMAHVAATCSITGAHAAYWPLDETSGSVAYDLTGNGHDGSIVGGVTLGQAGPHPDGSGGPWPSMAPAGWSR